MAGGLLAAWDWRAVFWVNVPVGILTAVAAVAVLPDDKPDTQAGLDWGGVGLIGVALLLFSVPLVEGRYRVRAHGIAGKSSGGYGALVQAARHPEVFRACACHAGDMAFEYCYLPDFPKFLRHVHQLGGLDAYMAAYRQLRDRGEEPGGPKRSYQAAAPIQPSGATPPYSDRSRIGCATR